jgi:hypothetical protein
VVLGVHQEGERGFEQLGHLLGARLEREARAHEGDHRHDPIAGHGFVGGRQTERFDEARLQPDLLPGLAQRRLDRPLAGIEPAARQGDLAGVAAEVVGAAGEQHGQPLRPLQHRDQHGGVPQRPPAGRLEVRIQVEVRAQPGRRPAAFWAVFWGAVQRIEPRRDQCAEPFGGHGWCAPAGPSGKKTPRELTPRTGPSGPARSSAMAASS